MSDEHEHGEMSGDSKINLQADLNMISDYVRSVISELKLESQRKDEKLSSYYEWSKNQIENLLREGKRKEEQITEFQKRENVLVKLINTERKRSQHLEDKCRYLQHPVNDDKALLAEVNKLIEKGENQGNGEEFDDFLTVATKKEKNDNISDNIYGTGGSEKVPEEYIIKIGNAADKLLDGDIVDGKNDSKDSSRNKEVTVKEADNDKVNEQLLDDEETNIDDQKTKTFCTLAMDTDTFDVIRFDEMKTEPTVADDTAEKLSVNKRKYVTIVEYSAQMGDNKIRDLASRLKTSKKGGKRLSYRCRSSGSPCAPCQSEDCGQCSSCKNMKKFGGTGSMRMKCMNRSCLSKL